MYNEFEEKIAEIQRGCIDTITALVKAKGEKPDNGSRHVLAIPTTTDKAYVLISEDTPEGCTVKEERITKVEHTDGMGLLFITEEGWRLSEEDLVHKTDALAEMVTILRAIR